MRSRIIALCGYPGVGKDEIAKYLVEKHGFVRVSFADPMRQALLALDPHVVHPDDGTCEPLSAIIDRLGWDQAKRLYPHIRYYLQRMGTEAGRDIHGSNCWVNLAVDCIEAAIASVRGVVVTDMRFSNEHQVLASRDALMVHVTRPGFGQVNNHISEQMDYAAVAHSHIDNCGSVDELHAKIELLLGEPGP